MQAACANGALLVEYRNYVKVFVKTCESSFHVTKNNIDPRYLSSSVLISNIQNTNRGGAVLET